MATHSDLPGGLPEIEASPKSSSGSISDPANQNIIAAIAYLGWVVTGAAILLLEKNNRYIRFHAAQSIIFSIAVFILNLSTQFVPFNALQFTTGNLINMVAFLVWIVLLYKAFIGEEYELPIIGPLAKRQV